MAGHIKKPTNLSYLGKIEVSIEKYLYLTRKFKKSQTRTNNVWDVFVNLGHELSLVADICIYIIKV